jgi:hypothetical protein
MRQQQDRLRQRLAEVPALPPVSQAVDLMALAANVSNLFLKQPGGEQRKLLRLVLDKATWKAGELRMSFRDPFSQLVLSNRESRTKDGHLKADERNFDTWRRKRDSNPRTSYPVNGFQDRRLQPLGHSSVLYLTRSMALAAFAGPRPGEAGLWRRSKRLRSTLKRLARYLRLKRNWRRPPWCRAR